MTLVIAILRSGHRKGLQTGCSSGHENDRRNIRVCERDFIKAKGTNRSKPTPNLEDQYVQFMKNAPLKKIKPPFLLHLETNLSQFGSTLD